MTVVFDTHSALWWSFFPEKLSPKATQAIASSKELVFPAIIFWETALLVRKRRLALPVSTEEWLRGLESTTRARIAPLTALLSLRADALDVHDDPADRFIISTALSVGAPLLTKDALIRRSGVVKTIW